MKDDTEAAWGKVVGYLWHLSEEVKTSAEFLREEGGFKAAVEALSGLSRQLMDARAHLECLRAEAVARAETHLALMRLRGDRKVEMRQNPDNPEELEWRIAQSKP